MYFPGYERKMAENKTVFAGEISRRKYPKALRPQAVFNSVGGNMSWDAWLRTPKGLDISGMMFEDGTIVGNIGTDNKREAYAAALSLDPVV